MERRFDLVLFDLDGTLIDNRVSIRDSVNFALNEFGFESVSDAKIDAQIGKHLPDIFKAFIPENKKDLADELSSAYRERYMTTSDQGLVVLEGAHEALSSLKKRGITQGIVTNKMEGAAQLLKKIGLYDNFEFVISPNAQLRPKPYPDMILSAIKMAKATASRTAYVGDTSIDMNSARNAKVSSVAVMTGVKMGIADQKELMEAMPDYAIANLSGLAKILAE
ncbi:MAG: HAD family hydrolase [Candidatus Micrarchaeota archaeon]|nr:HAD family hydrolase [Candidatus Micrarchaeota archaeon]